MNENMINENEASQPTGEEMTQRAAGPDNAEDYNAEFVPGILQADGVIMIYFRTDDITLDKYRQFAKENGGVRKHADKWLSLVRHYGADIADSCEVYMLPRVYGYHPVYYICTESGYFALYW